MGCLRYPNIQMYWPQIPKFKLWQNPWTEITFTSNEIPLRLSMTLMCQMRLKELIFCAESAPSWQKWGKDIRVFLEWEHCALNGCIYLLMACAEVHTWQTIPNRIEGVCLGFTDWPSLRLCGLSRQHNLRNYRRKKYWWASCCSFGRVCSPKEPTCCLTDSLQH